MYTTRCKKCGCEIVGDEYSHPIYCKPCADTINLDNMKKRQQMKRDFKEELGTRNFGSKMKKNSDNTPNFKAELRAIRKELKSLGLRKDGTSKTT